MKNTSSIKGCVVFGSLARGEFTENSDIDILCCKQSGFFNGILAYSAGIRERTIAFWMRIPIELYFYDIEAFNKLDENEHPLSIKDEEHEISSIIQYVIPYEKYPFFQQAFFDIL